MPPFPAKSQVQVFGLAKHCILCEASRISTPESHLSLKFHGYTPESLLIFVVGFSCVCFYQHQAIPEIFLPSEKLGLIVRPSSCSSVSVSCLTKWQPLLQAQAKTRIFTYLSFAFTLPIPPVPTPVIFICSIYLGAVPSLQPRGWSSAARGHFLAEFLP